MKGASSNENNRFMNLMMMAMMMSNQTHIFQQPQRLMKNQQEEAKEAPSEFTPMRILQSLGIPLQETTPPIVAQPPKPVLPGPSSGVMGTNQMLGNQTPYMRRGQVSNNLFNFNRQNTKQYPTPNRNISPVDTKENSIVLQPTKPPVINLQKVDSVIESKNTKIRM